MHRDFLVDDVNVVSLGGQPPRTSVKEIVLVPQRIMRKQLMNEVSTGASEVGGLGEHYGRNE